MKSPITGKEMILKQEVIEQEFRKEKFQIVYHSYLCEDSGESFEDERLVDFNLNQVYNQYREKHNIPFPDEIISIRNQYGISASKMSEVLGFGINVYGRYEQGEIPSSSNARLIQLAKDPAEFKKLLDLSGEDKYIERINSKIKEQQESEQSGMRSIHEYLLGKLIATIETGYKIPTLDKIAAMVAFFALEVQPWKTKLNKLLFYSDFYHFKKYGFSISGCRYRAIDMGPVPNNFQGIFENIALHGIVEIKYTELDNGGIGEQFLPSKQFINNPEIFSKLEWETLKLVRSSLGDLPTKKIINVSHDEIAWKKNFQGGRSLIKYIDAFELKHL